MPGSSGKSIRKAAQVRDSIALSVLVSLRRGKYQHGNVAIVVQPGFRLLQLNAHRASALNRNVVPDDNLHGELGSNPRPRTATPSCIVGHVNLHSKPVGLFTSELKQFVPFWIAKTRATEAWRSTLIHIHDQNTGDTHRFHGLEIGRDAFASYVDIQPEPIDPRSTIKGRRGKFIFCFLCGRNSGVAAIGRLCLSFNDTS